MKLLTILFLAILTIKTTNVISQKSTVTRYQTESWLLEKLNKYVAANSIDCKHLDPTNPMSMITDCFIYTNISFSFSGNDLIINSNVEKTYKGISESKFTRVITIPIYDVQDYSYFTFNEISFSTNFNSITLRDSNGETSKRRFFSLWFSSTEEENFIERFSKAMTHLRTFVKKPKSKEPF